MNSCLLIKDIEQFNNDFVYFCEPIKNNIMNDSNFIRLIYSTPQFTLNGIYINLPINCHLVDKYYNKIKCSFNTETHKELITKIKNIEECILKKMCVSDKIPCFKVSEQLCSGTIKVFSENVSKVGNNSFLLKIAGIWESDTSYGLTYKFVII